MKPRERAILFSAPMIRALLEGRKTQTRRVIVPRSADLRNLWHCYPGHRWSIQAHPGGGWLGFDDPNGIPQKYLDDLVARGRKGFPCPYGVVGDRFWVRETWQAAPDCSRQKACYRADYTEGLAKSCPLPWRPSIFMPRWASRIILELTYVRVERVQEITEEDAKAEGYDDSLELCHRCGGHYETDAIAWYRSLWNSLNVKRGFGWDMNPWVWVLMFRRLA